MQPKFDQFGYPIRRDPPLPPLASPDPITIFDLTPEERARVEIYVTHASYKWRFKNGQ